MFAVSCNYNLVRRALRSGFLAWLLGVLLAALFSSPVVAMHHDFNHFHPEDTSEHYHGIDSTLGWPVMTNIVVVIALFIVAELLPVSLWQPRFRLYVRQVKQARAPPGRRQVICLLLPVVAAGLTAVG